MTGFYGGIGIVGNGGSGTGGVGIANIEITADRHFIIYLSDGTKRDLGIIDGATFKPTIENGVIKWSNDKGLENPPDYDLSVDIEEEGELWIPVNESSSEEIAPATEYMWEKI